MCVESGSERQDPKDKFKIRGSRQLHFLTSGFSPSEIKPRFWRALELPGGLIKIPYCCPFHTHPLPCTRIADSRRFGWGLKICIFLSSQVIADESGDVAGLRTPVCKPVSYRFRMVPLMQEQRSAVKDTKMNKEIVLRNEGRQHTNHYRRMWQRLQ